ncbi:MAG TPA: hypothetical protein PK495_07800 [Bacteroidales bacterium]|nr:hypothetical protein [Bacteroidales bacterium]HQB20465.1 hypothetical protein [Bacteroidales bacterium]
MKRNNLREYQERRLKESLKRAERIRKQYVRMQKQNLAPGFIVTQISILNNCSRSTVYAAIPSLKKRNKRNTGNAGERPVVKA